ncbi:hypothetical protein ACHAXA_008880 [Cyclostephanos tholiformis]|uniref:Uncharacterized protein n=1 Tax=Cyclostephanos tholiformis TaxID=382380 RepID=A0ABD3SFR3_9STRA
MASQPNDGSGVDRVLHDDDDDWSRVYFDIAIPSSPHTSEYAPLGRLTFRLVPPSHPHHLPLHASNLMSLASGDRRSLDSRATYVGCEFKHSPASVEDGSMRYRWAHVCDGHGRNGIRTISSEGVENSRDSSFSDPLRMRGCAHDCFGGVYYGIGYEEVLDRLHPWTDDPAILLTVPIHGPGAGTSKFSIVRVEESPKEWGVRLLHSSAVMGYLDCGADGSIGGVRSSGDDDDDGGTPMFSEDDGPVTAFEVLRAMARQRMGPPRIVGCGVSSIFVNRCA